MPSAKPVAAASATTRPALAAKSANIVPAVPVNSNGKRPVENLKSASATSNAANSNEESDSDSSADGSIPITHNCDQIRRLITRLLDSGEMKTGELIDKLNVSGPGYYRFMKQNGRDKGFGSDTYSAALKFFQRREAKGIKLPPKKKAKTAASAGTSNEPATNRTTAAAAPFATSRNASTLSTSTSTEPSASIILPGEFTDSVPIYDTCDTIRRKINAHLREPDVTQASFLRALEAQYHRRPRKIQSAQLQRFRQMKGPSDGIQNVVYYAAYVFFEKERIRTGKQKGKQREEMESIYVGGVDTSRQRRGVWCMKGDAVSMDKHGRYVINGRTY